MQDSNFRATLKTKFGKYFSVDFRPGDTFEDLKKRIVENVGDCLEIRNLTYNDSPVTECQNILEYITAVCEKNNIENVCFEDLCRLCAKTSLQMYDVFTCVDMVYYCLSIEISQSDTLPKKICLPCMNLLNSFQNFKNNSLKTESTLTALWESKNDRSNRSNSVTLETPYLNDASNLISSYKTPCSPKNDSNQNEDLETNDNEDSQEDDHSNIEKHDDKLILPCKWCNETFTAVMDLYNHSLIHTGYSDKRKKKKTDEDFEKPKRVRKVVQKQTCYICTMCNQVFPMKGLLQVHFNESHKTMEKNVQTGGVLCVSRVFSCVYCEATYVRFRQLLKHCKKCLEINSSKLICNEQDSKSQLWHVPIIKPFRHKCEFCCKFFTTLRYLSNHKLGINQLLGTEKHYQCEECKKNCFSECALKYHKKSHSFSKDYICELCGRTFIKLQSLTNHKIKHSNARPFKCNECPKTFKTKEQMRMHSRVHSGERPYCCKVCNRTFKTSGVLSKHKRTHSDIRPFTCNMCPSAFKTSYTRGVHMLIHTGQKPYECHFCAQNFRYRKDRTKHEQSIHDATLTNLT